MTCYMKWMKMTNKIAVTKRFLFNMSSYSLRMTNKIAVTKRTGFVP